MYAAAALLRIEGIQTGRVPEMQLAGYGVVSFLFILHLDNARLALHNGQKLYNRKKSGRSGKLTAKKYIYQTKGGDQQ